MKPIFITLSSSQSTGLKMIVNANLITQMYETGPGRVATKIIFAKDNVIGVKETPDEIMALIKKA